MRLQNHLARARVLYAPATGASEVNNFAYVVRLGLWGPETVFANRERFITESYGYLPRTHAQFRRRRI
ncbi:MAG: strawberry notch family protein [Novosphingobium sp.]